MAEYEKEFFSNRGNNVGRYNLDYEVRGGKKSVKVVPTETPSVVVETPAHRPLLNTIRYYVMYDPWGRRIRGLFR